MATFFDTNKYSASVSTANWITTGHDGADAMIIGGSGKLILSASNGITHISGAIDIGLLPDNKNYHIRAIGSPLILSCSVGSYIDISGGLGFSNAAVAAHVVERTGHLILSSSAGSNIFVSGALTSSDGLRTLGQLTVGAAVRAAGDYVSTGGGTSAVRDTNNTFYLTSDKLEFRRTGKISFDKDTVGAGVSGDEFQLVNAKGFGGQATMPSGTLGLSSSLANTVVNGMTLTSLRGDLILSASETSIVSVSSSLNFPIDAVSTRSHINSNTAHLVLSSSTSLVRISGALGALDTTTAALPANAIILSGAIVWDSTRKALKVYGPLGWTVIATGTVG